MHNKEQQKQSTYFNRIADVIKNYNEVLLFGPTDAKSELLNLLKTDHLFENIKMEVKQTGILLLCIQQNALHPKSITKEQNTESMI